MPTLVLRNVPDDLYQRLKVTAADHRRSMTQEVIVSLHGALLGREEPPPKLGLEDNTGLAATRGLVAPGEGTDDSAR